MSTKTPRNSAGVTLVELMVSITAAAILSLIVILLLSMAFRSWRFNNGLVDMRRDSAFAFSMMTRDIREAEDSGLLNNSGALEIKSGVDETVVSYVQNGNALEYDDGSGSGLPVISDHVRSFTFQLNSDGALLSLALENADLGIALTNEVFVNTRN